MRLNEVKNIEPRDAFKRLLVGDENIELFKAVLKDPFWAEETARQVIKDRWPAAEPIIMNDPKAAYNYARDIIKGRWPEGEKAIATDSDYAYLYADEVIKGRWPEGEKAIASDPTTLKWYNIKFGTNL